MANLYISAIYEYKNMNMNMHVHVHVYAGLAGALRVRPASIGARVEAREKKIRSGVYVGGSFFNCYWDCYL